MLRLTLVALAAVLASTMSLAGPNTPQLPHAFLEGNPTTPMQKAIAAATGGKSVTHTIYNGDGSVNIGLTATLAATTNDADTADWMVRVGQSLPTAVITGHHDRMVGYPDRMVDIRAQWGFANMAEYETSIRRNSVEAGFTSGSMYSYYRYVMQNQNNIDVTFDEGVLHWATNYGQYRVNPRDWAGLGNQLAGIGSLIPSR